MNNKPNAEILVLTTSYPRNSRDDVSIFVKRLAHALSALVSRVIVIAPLNPNGQAEETEGRVVIKRFRYGLFFRGDLAYGPGLLPNLRNRPWLGFQLPGMILAMAFVSRRHTSSRSVILANWILAGWAAFILRLIHPAQYVLVLRGSDMSLLDIPVVKFFYYPVLAKAQTVVVVSKCFEEKLTKLFPSLKTPIKHIPNGVAQIKISSEDLFNFRNEHNLKENGKYLVSVATLIPLKRIEALIRIVSFPALNEFELILCGKMDHASYVNELRALATELGCAERVRFEGQVPPDVVPFYLNVARYFLSFSSFEGRPNAVIEALAAGTPVLLSNIAGHCEIVTDGVNGFVYSIDDLEKVAQRILSLESSPKERERIIEAGRESIREYSWERCASEYYKVAQSLN